MADGANIGAGIAAFLGGFASGAAKQHVTNTLERRKLQQKAMLDATEDAVKSGDVGYVESQQKNLAGLFGKDMAQAWLERARTNTPQAKFGRALEMLSQGDLSGLLGGGGQAEAPTVPSAPTAPVPETEAFRGLVAPSTIQEETITAQAQPQPRPTTPAPAPVAPRKPIL